MTVQRRKDDKGRVLKDNESQRKNGTYEFKYTDKYGKRKSAYAKTLEELRIKEEAITMDKRDGIKSDGKFLTINDFYKRWIELKRGLKENTFQNYKYMYTQFVEPGFGNSRIKDLKRSDVKAFYNYLHDERCVKANTIDSIHTVLHQVIQLAVDDDYIRYNPSDSALKELLKAHNAETEKKKGLTKEEQDILEAFLKKPGKYHHWYPIFITMLYTGLRCGETVGLRWEDVDFENNTISVNHTLVYYDKGGKERCSFAINTPKTKAGIREIPMLTIVRDALLEEKAYQEEVGIKCNVVVDGYTNFIFVNRFGNVQHQGTLNKALRRIVRDCNDEILLKNSNAEVLLPRTSNHSLRHSFTNRLLEANVNIKAIQGILGHKDPTVTLGVYADATKELMSKNMSNLQSFFDNMQKND